MNISALLIELAARDVNFTLSGDRLRFRPLSAITPDVMTSIKTCKAEVVSIIQRICGASTREVSAKECLRAVEGQHSWENGLPEALRRVASLYDANTYERLSPTQKQKLAECDENLDRTLVSPNGDYQSAIEEWEREWCLALGYHPVPSEQLFRIQNWDDQKIWAALQKGIPVKIWSVVLGEWIYWVRDTQVAEKTKAKYPDIPIYTLQELKIMTQAKWTREYLQKTHLAKSVLGATLVESSWSDHGCE